MLLLLTAAAAIIFALVGSATRQNQQSFAGGLAATNGLLTFVAGGVLGGVLGMSYRNPASGFFIGSTLGGLSGAAAGVLSASKFSLPLALSGAAAIVVLGAVVRFGSSPRT